MKLKFDYIDNIIEIEEGFVNSVEVENKKYFYRMINDLINISINGEKPIMCLNNDLEEINVGNKVKVFIDYFNFEFESKKYNNDLIKYLNETIFLEEKDKLLNIYNKYINQYRKLLYEIDLPVVIQNDTNIDNILKEAKVTISQSDNLLDNLFLLIDLEKNLNLNSIIVFVNLKQYLTKNELIELYKYSLYNLVDIILIDSQCYGVKLDYEKKLIIDADLEEFVL